MKTINDIIERKIKGNDFTIPTPSSLGLEYNSFMEVATEARDLLILDLAVHTSQLPKSYADSLRPCPDGIYTLGSIEPVLLFNADTVYYTAKQYKTNKAVPDVRNFNDFIKVHGPVVNASGKIVAQSPVSNARMFRPTCAFNHSAIYLAAIAIYDVFDHLNANTTPRTNLTQAQLNAATYLQLDAGEEWFKPEETPGIAELLKDVYKFIGRDIHAIYRVCLKNTTIHIEKGNDYRVIEYYRQIFEAFEERLAQDYF